MEEFYTVNQTAKLLKVHPLTIRRYIKEGKLKAYRAAGNIRLALSDLKEFTQSFVPQSKPSKEMASSSSAQFFLSDPLFRLKARGLSLNKTERGG